MKRLLVGLVCLASIGIQALEYEQQLENDQMIVSKVKIGPHEEIGLHRDAYPQLVIALQGGTITRLEADGRTTDVHFPTGVTVSREADPENELHRSVNNSSEPVELMIIQLKNRAPTAQQINGNSHDLSINIKIHRPAIDESQELTKPVPTEDNCSTHPTECESSFVNNMDSSDEISPSWWSLQTKDSVLKDE